jgi:hypothetical protein
MCTFVYTTHAYVLLFRKRLYFLYNPPTFKPATDLRIQFHIHWNTYHNHSFTVVIIGIIARLFRSAHSHFLNQVVQRSFVDSDSADVFTQAKRIVTDVRNYLLIFEIV